MKYFVTIILLFLSISQNTYSQDTNTIKYLPLSIGNTWVYYYTTSNFMGNGSGYDIFKITGTSQINGKSFFVFQHTNIIITGTYGCSPLLFGGGPIRVDSFSCNIYSATNCNSSPVILIDSLHSKIRDTASLCMLSQDNKDVCTDTSMYNIFGTQFASKHFSNTFFEGINLQIYARNIGLVYHYYNQVMSSCWTNLRGCIINGQLFGDTSTLVAINQINTQVPKQFSLYQNYPNPFNPSTKIKFDIPNVGNGRDRSALLKIYDALGREITTLVNEHLNPGTYEVEWDAGNYPSGIYFYKLETSNYNETKRMVLIK